MSYLDPVQYKVIQYHTHAVQHSAAHTDVVVNGPLLAVRTTHFGLCCSGAVSLKMAN